MSGLLKAKKYDWKDSNLALFGSDTEKEVKKESAESEPAWQGCGQEPGLKIWRIVNFEVKDWPEKEYGEFYSGDSYIVLKTTKDEDSDNLSYDVHFWIGKNSTQDEYGTVAYKTVELDTFLNDAAVQHRECQGHESELFKSYFPRGIQTMKGGADSGFRHVTPEEYTPRLLRFNGTRKNITVREVPKTKGQLKSSDVFILDTADVIYQWNGSESNKDERFKAMQYMQQLESEKGGCKDETLDEESISSAHKFYDLLTDEDDDADSDDDEPEEADTKLLKYNAESTEFEPVKEGGVAIEDFASDDVFLLETKAHVFVWIGNNASKAEKKNGFSHGNKYLMGTPKFYRPISVLNENSKNGEFIAALAA